MVKNIFSWYISQYHSIPKKSWERAIASLMNSLASGTVFFLSLYFTLYLHLNVQSSCFLISCYGVGATAGGIVGGKISDKIGPEIVSAISLLVKSLAFFILIVINSFPCLMSDMFIIGFVSFSFLAANQHSALKHCKNIPEQKMKVISILQVCSKLGIGVSAVLVGHLGKKSFDIIFILSALLLLCGSVYLLILFLQSTKDIILEPKNIHKKIISSTEKGYGLYVSVLCLFLLTLVASQRASTYPLYITRIFPRMSLDWLGILFMLNPFMIIVFQTPIINVFKNMSKFSVMGVGIFLYGFGSFILVFASSYEIAVLSCIVLSIGEMLSFSAILFMFYESAYKNRKGSNVGLYQSTYGMSITIGPLAGGIIYSNFGGEMIWNICGLIGCVCLGICLYATKYISY